MSETIEGVLCVCGHAPSAHAGHQPGTSEPTHCACCHDCREYRPASRPDTPDARAAELLAALLAAPRQPKRNADALKDAIGKWPGDDSDEQVREALEELS